MFKEWFNWKVAEGVIRNLSQALAGFLVTQGAISHETEVLIPGVAIGIGALIWSIVAGIQAKRNSRIVHAVKQVVPSFDPARDTIVPAHQTTEPGVQVTVKRDLAHDPILEAGRK